MKVESHSKLLKLNLNNTIRCFAVFKPAAMNWNLKLTLRANEITFTQQMTVFAGADEVLLIWSFKMKSLGKGWKTLTDAGKYLRKCSQPF